MHELGIVYHIIRDVENVARANGVSHVSSVTLLLGEVSGVVTTPFGYHIIYKADEKGGGKQTLVDVHDQIKDLLRHEARGRAMDAFVAELREKARVELKECCGRHLHGEGCGCTCGK